MIMISKHFTSLGNNISIDEQDIGFQGLRRDKQCILSTSVGGGYLVDALCSHDYTFTWYFTNQVAPKH